MGIREHSYHLIVFTTTGGMGGKATVFYKHLANLILTKNNTTMPGMC